MADDVQNQRVVAARYLGIPVSEIKPEDIKRALVCIDKGSMALGHGIVLARTGYARFAMTEVMQGRKLGTAILRKNSGTRRLARANVETGCTVQKAGNASFAEEQGDAAARKGKAPTVHSLPRLCCLWRPWPLCPPFIPNP